MDGFYNDFLTWLEAYSPKLIGAFAIFLLGWLLIKIIRGIMVKTFKQTKMEKTTSSFLVSLTYILLFVVVVFMSLQTLGVFSIPVAALIGTLGLTVGLALQGTLSNVASGIVLVSLKQLKTGEFVTAGGESGTVTEVGLFNTMLTTPDNRLIYVPNNSIISGSITNFSRNETRRVDMVFGISYSDDMSKAKDIIKNLIETDERSLKKPEYQVVISELADNSVNITMRVWTKTSDYWSFHFDMMENVKRRFDEEGISIPFPQREVHVIQNN